MTAPLPPSLLAAILYLGGSFYQLPVAMGKPPGRAIIICCVRCGVVALFAHRGQPVCAPPDGLSLACSITLPPPPPPSLVAWLVIAITPGVQLQRHRSTSLLLGLFHWRCYRIAGLAVFQATAHTWCPPEAITGSSTVLLVDPGLRHSTNPPPFQASPAWRFQNYSSSNKASHPLHSYFPPLQTMERPCLFQFCCWWRSSATTLARRLFRPFLLPG